MKSAFKRGTVLGELRIVNHAGCSLHLKNMSILGTVRGAQSAFEQASDAAEVLQRAECAHRSARIPYSAAEDRPRQRGWASSDTVAAH